MKALRARLIHEGQSLEEWSKARGVWRQNLTKALLGEWKGPRAEELVSEAIAFIREGTVC